MTDTRDSLREAALEYHRSGKPGKLEIRATKPLANGRDLARAYSPGLDARAPILPSPRTAEPFETTATRLPRAV